MIHFKCAKCSDFISVPETDAGQSQACPHCDNVNVVPQVSTEVGPTPPTPAPAASPAPATAADPQKQAWQWAMWCHLAGLASVIGIPFANIIAPLIIWQVKKDEHPFIDQAGKASLNFQISMTIYSLAAIPLVFVFVGIFLLIAIAVVDIVFVILAALKANSGEAYKYPLSIRFLK